MTDGKDSLAEWFSSCFISNQDFVLDEEETLCSEGATCLTYKVRIDGRLYLLKRLKPEFAEDPRFIVALQKEYHVGSTLSHPALVKYVQAGHASLLMEYVNGKTLTQLLQEEPSYFSQPGQAERFLCQLLEGVGHMHEHHVLHLDLKPDNVMISQLGHDVRIIDLGFCYTDCYDNTRGYTRGFAAPEQVKGGELTERTDIYAVGRIMEWVNRKTKSKVFPTEVIRQCTAEDVADRYADTGAVLCAYKEVVGHRHSKSRTMAIALAFAAVMVGALMYFMPGDTVVPKRKEPHPGAMAVDSVRNGVYVMDWAGRLVKPEQWDTTYQALAVALVASEFQARIALEDCNGSMVWGPDGLNLNVIASTAEDNDDGGEGLKDYTGEYNTFQFIYRTAVDDTTALYASHHFHFDDGSVGYLPALGELDYVYRNCLKKVNETLVLCGGKPLKTWHWTSTQKMRPNRAWALNFDDGKCFAQLRSGQSAGAEMYGAFRCSVRPFGAIKRRVESDYETGWAVNSKNNAIQQEKLERIVENQKKN